jgi:hypothetical protein
MNTEQQNRNQSSTPPQLTAKGISIITTNLPIGIAVVFGGTRTLTKLKRNLSVHKRFPAQPVVITLVFIFYRLSTLKFRLLERSGRKLEA